MCMMVSKGGGTAPDGPALAGPLLKEGLKNCQLTKNQIKCISKNRAGNEQLGYEPWNTSKVP